MQTILNFGIESTEEKLTRRVGVAIFGGEYLKVYFYSSKKLLSAEIMLSNFSPIMLHF